MSPAGRALVLTYHSIAAGKGPLRTAPDDLEAHLDLLARAGYEVVPLSAIAEDLRSGAPLRGDRCALTFDDGYRDFAEAALPRLERRGLPATLFATASPDRERLPGGLPEPLLGLDELAGLAARGVEIGAHSLTHVDLTRLAPDALERELAECASALSEKLGRPVASFAYPFGVHDAAVRAAVARRFAAACTTRLARVESGCDPYAVPRVDAYYLRSPWLRRLLERGRPDGWLAWRSRLRRWRGSETAERRSAEPQAACGTLAGEVVACPS